MKKNQSHCNHTECIWNGWRVPRYFYNDIDKAKHKVLILSCTYLKKCINMITCKKKSLDQHIIWFTDWTIIHSSHWVIENSHKCVQNTYKASTVDVSNRWILILHNIVKFIDELIFRIEKKNTQVISTYRLYQSWRKKEFLCII